MIRETGEGRNKQRCVHSSHQTVLRLYEQFETQRYNSIQKYLVYLAARAVSCSLELYSWHWPPALPTTPRYPCCKKQDELLSWERQSKDREKRERSAAQRLWSSAAPPAARQHSSQQHLPARNESHLYKRRNWEPERHQICPLILLPTWRSAKQRGNKSFLQKLWGNSVKTAPWRGTAVLTQRKALVPSRVADRQALAFTHQHRPVDLAVLENHICFLKFKQKRH